MSKSGLFSRFASKQELQLATIDTAEAVYAAEVIEPAMQFPEGRRASSSCASATCPTSSAASSPAAASLPPPPPSGTPGADRSEIACARCSPAGTSCSKPTSAPLNGTGARARRRIGQLVFEINALLHEANGHYLLFDDSAALDRAQTAITDRLARAQR